MTTQQPYSPKARCLVCAVLLCFSLAIGSCGTDFIIIVAGTIASRPVCEAGGGRFDMTDTQGLFILVVISSDTLIFASSGSVGRCSTLATGQVVEVRGEEQGGQIDAQEIRIR